MVVLAVELRCECMWLVNMPLFPRKRSLISKYLCSLWIILVPGYLCDSSLLLGAKAVISLDHITISCPSGVKSVMLNCIGTSVGFFTYIQDTLEFEALLCVLYCIALCQ